MLRPRDYPLLHDFAVVAREGNLTKAAEALNTVQSAVTQRMKRLEEAVGTKLLKRHSRGVVPTEQGLILLRYAKGLDALIKGAVAEIEDWEGSPRGAISVGLPPSVSAVLATPLIEAVNTALPHVELTVAEAFSGYLTGWLENDEIDFAFVFNQVSDASMVVTPVLEEELFLITDPGTRQRLPEKLRLRDMCDLPLIAPSRRHRLRTDVEEAAHKQGLQLDIRLEVDAGYQLIRQILRGGGSAVLARAAVMAELTEGQLKAVPITEPTFTRTVCLAIKREKASSYLFTRAKGVIIDVIETLIADGRWPAKKIASP